MKSLSIYAKLPLDSEPENLKSNKQFGCRKALWAVIACCALTCCALTSLRIKRNPTQSTTIAAGNTAMISLFDPANNAPGFNIVHLPNKTDLSLANDLSSQKIAFEAKLNVQDHYYANVFFSALSRWNRTTTGAVLEMLTSSIKTWKLQIIITELEFLKKEQNVFMTRNEDLREAGQQQFKEQVEQIKESLAKIYAKMTKNFVQYFSLTEEAFQNTPEDTQNWPMFLKGPSFARNKLPSCADVCGSLPSSNPKQGGIFICIPKCDGSCDQKFEYCTQDDPTSQQDAATGQPTAGQSSDQPVVSEIRQQPMSNISHYDQTATTN